MPESQFHPNEEVTALATPLPQNVWETSFDDETITAQDFDTYKGRKGVTDRIGILQPTKVKISRIHFQTGLGFVLCNSEYRLQGNMEVCTKVAPCCEHLPEAKKRITTTVIKYDTKPDGSLIEPFGFTLLVWRFSDDKFVQLRNINKEWPLTEHDLLASCDEETYQRMAFSACKQALFRAPKFIEVHGKQVEQWLQAIEPKLIKAAGRKLTNQELLERIGKSHVQPGGAAVADAPVADIADLLGTR